LEVEVWALLHIAPAQIPDIKKSLITYGMEPNRKWTLTTGGPKSVVKLYPFAADRHPAWWRPEEILDADVVLLRTGSGLFAVFSAKTGMIYFLHWDV
jgi:hypothetical protein